MGNIFSSKTEKSILKDERYLYPEYLPEQIPFREQEISEMVFCLKPALKGQKPTNIFISGKPGTGKTVSAKYVLSELEEFSDRAKPLYINVFDTNSRNSILSKATNFFGYPLPTRGLSSDEIYERFVSVIKAKKILPILVFDEAEQLLKKEDTKKLLYDLSRINEQFNLNIGLVFISNDSFFLSLIDDRIRSSLNSSVLTFEKYSSLQLKSILKERARFAFFQNSLDENVIPLCAANASKLGDARIAIGTLLKSARIAEKDNSKKVLVKHVRLAFEQEKPKKIEIIQNLSSQEKLVLDSINESVFSTELYEKLKNNFAERTIRKAIADLKEKKLIEVEIIKKGKGLSRKITKK